jgi:hypothetical protein
MTAPSNAVPTSASQWGSSRLQGVLVELPSGNTARIRRQVDLMVMLKTGQIPNPLAGIIHEMIRSGAKDFPKDKMDEKPINQMLQMVEDICVKVFIEPRVEAPPQDLVDREEFQPSEGAISVDDLTVQDKFFVFQFVQGGSKDLEPFRLEPNQAVAVAQDGSGVPVSSE